MIQAKFLTKLKPWRRAGPTFLELAQSGAQNTSSILLFGADFAWIPHWPGGTGTFYFNKLFSSEIHTFKLIWMTEMLWNRKLRHWTSLGGNTPSCLWHAFGRILSSANWHAGGRVSLGGRGGCGGHYGRAMEYFLIPESKLKNSEAYNDCYHITNAETLIKYPTFQTKSMNLHQILNIFVKLHKIDNCGGKLRSR